MTFISTRERERERERKFTTNVQCSVQYTSILFYLMLIMSARRMRWAGHMARMGEERGCVGSWWGNQRERDHWGDLSLEGWIILGWISMRWDVGIWTGLGWPRIATCGGGL